MNKQHEQLDTLREIRTLMERSSRFISLSGLSGVVAGVVALIAVSVIYLRFQIKPIQDDVYNAMRMSEDFSKETLYRFIFLDAFLVLMVSLVSAVLLAKSKAKKLNHPIWDATTKRMLLNLAIPLVAGGLYCFMLLNHGYLQLIAPAMLIFYGIALLNASKYTLNDIRYLGILEIITGLIASLVLNYGLIFGAFGFGVLHIIYGIALYNKYEK